MNQQYRYRALGSLVNTNTLSSNSKYYYKMLKPESLGMATFWTRLAFYNTSDELIYFNGQAICLPQPFATLEYAIWSKQGNVVFFNEVSKINKEVEIVILHLSKSIAYRIQGSDNDRYKLFESIGLVDRLFDEDKLLDILVSNNVKSGALITDSIPKRTIADYLLRRGKWFPRV